MTKYVYDFVEGDKNQKDLLGGKGANLAEMTNLGIPVPAGFTITTEACKEYLNSGSEPAELRSQVVAGLAKIEKTMGKKLGDQDDPLLISVRSGAKFSMPGMMETVLNIGLNDLSVEGIARQSGSERFAWDSYRRLLQMFGRTVLSIEGKLFDEALEKVKSERGTTADLDLTADDFKDLIGRYKLIIREQTGADFPQDPREQLNKAIHAVFDSWNTERAVLYRRQERIPADLGTAVNVMAMVFGNVGMDSGTGVAFTRDPGSGDTGEYGDYLQNAQGEDVVAGIRNTLPLHDLERLDKKSYEDLTGIMQRLEQHYRDLCDIEFTIERGKLWMLQTRVGKRTAGAAFRIATQLVDEGLIDMDEALQRVTGAQLMMLMFPQFDAAATDTTLIARGMNASPGAAVGKAVFDSHRAVDWAARGEKVILVRKETNPDDLNGMIAAEGILTSRGGKTSHAAVVARGMGKTCISGADELDVDVTAGQFTAPGGLVVREGDVISIDGTSGAVFLGEVPVVPSPVVQYFEGTIDPDTSDDPLVKSVHRLMVHADEARRLGVEANADTPEDAARARRFGAGGIGLCRTEHMFLGDRRKLVERLILADTDDEKDSALQALLPMQRQDFIEILEAMDGLTVTIRLLDPPLHEFLPSLENLSVERAVAQATGKPPSSGRSTEELDKLYDAVVRLHEQNPMLGMRGVRLGLVVEGLFPLQVRAISEAAIARKKAGGDPRPQIMIPLIGAVQELEITREEAEQVLGQVRSENGGIHVETPIGTMIELPRAALTAGQIAQVAEFFSFGTNDLTQTTWGFSRDDVESAFFSRYLDLGIFGVSPFETIDREGVGALVKMATETGRAANPKLEIGVCGEHGGDPESVHFFNAVGVDYVSCSPFRVPVARLEAGRASSGVVGSDTR